MAQPKPAAHSNAVDAAFNLSTDVNAAIEALENLKRLLQNKRSYPVQARLGTRGGSYLELVVQETQQSPLMLEQALPQGAMTALLPADVVPAVEPRRPDIRGFLAGIALSAAIGALLYIFLVAG